MKQLYIIRHGKSSWDLSVPDIDRPLKERGINDAYKMADRLLQKGQYPELILSSTANRASHSAIIFARIFELEESNIELNEHIYLTGTNTVLDIISKVDDSVNSLMIFGHNPTFTTFANHFLKDKIDWLPTSGVVSVSFDTKIWTNIPMAKPTTNFVIYPKALN